MSLMENIIGHIATQGLSGITKPQGFDLDDDTFSSILDKAMNVPQSGILKTQSVAGFGIPSGMIIEPFDGVSSIETSKGIAGVSEPFEIKDVELEHDYFSNIIKTSDYEHSDIINLTQKQATRAYNSFGKKLIDDLECFVEDLTTTHS
ncbi:MAG: hypothetical protein MJ237_05690 [bacterium]|nr:hypothetical protein [bacterium]